MKKLILSLVIMLGFTTLFATSLSPSGQLTEEQWTIIRNTPNLKKLDLSSISNSWIPVGALQSSSIDSLIFPNILDVIPTNFCEGCLSLKYIKFPNNKVDIRQGAFSNCTSLKDISITGGANISFSVFSNSGVTNLDIKGETTMNALSLNGTQQLTTVVIENVQAITPVENKTTLSIAPTVTTMTITTTSTEPKVLTEVNNTVVVAQTTSPNVVIIYTALDNTLNNTSNDVVTSIKTNVINPSYVYISLKTGLISKNLNKGEMYIVYSNNIKLFKTIIL